LIEVISSGASTIRVDNSEPHRVYKDFWEWLFDDWHVIFVVGLFIGYFYYLLTTTEVY
jgi:hypothetical protein